MRITIICLMILLVLTACDSKDEDAEYRWDGDFVEHNRLYSPDGTKLILTYSYNIKDTKVRGERNAVLKIPDLDRELTKLNLPANYTWLEWLDNQTVSAKADILPVYRTGENIEIKDLEINGVKIKAAPYDYIEDDYHFELQYREASPDGKLEVIVYRYLKDSKSLSPLHVSVITRDESIPKYGNFFIGNPESDLVFACNWNSDNTLTFYTNAESQMFARNNFVFNKPRIPYQVEIDPLFAKQTRWKNQVNENKLKFGTEHFKGN